jgi:hypothetical protein
MAIENAGEADSTFLLISKADGVFGSHKFQGVDRTNGRGGLTSLLLQKSLVAIKSALESNK